jgi:twin arginine-targeting protein translocase TatB
MFDFSFGELVLLGIIALLVVGPEKLPELARTAGKWYGAMRRTMNSLRTEVEQQLLLEDLRKETEKLRDFANEELLPSNITIPSSPKNLSSKSDFVLSNNSMTESQQIEIDLTPNPSKQHSMELPNSSNES